MLAILAIYFCIQTLCHSLPDSALNLVVPATLTFSLVSRNGLLQKSKQNVIRESQAKACTAMRSQ